MLLSKTELNQLTEQLIPIIREAGHYVKKMREEKKISVEIKEDGSPVTNADCWANTFLKENMQSFTTGHYIVGEEDEDKTYPANAPLVWYIDPIDGTRAFIDGGKDYFILAGLVCNGQPVLGLHFQPETGRLIIGCEGTLPYMTDENNNKIYLPAFKKNGVEEKRIHIKTPNADLRNEIIDLGLKRAVYAPGMVDMIAPLFGKSNGFLSYRPTAFWDLAAPAAIMSSAGFKISSKPNGLHPATLFNTGAYKTNFFYSLPENTPDSVIMSFVATGAKHAPLF